MQLNPSQQQAVSCTDNCLIVACPGSGKTRLLTVKATQLIKGNPDIPIIIVSFTRDSVKEIHNRLEQSLGRAVPKTCVVSTFHSLFLKQLKRLGKTPRIVTGDVQKSYARRAWIKHGQKVLPTPEDAYALIESRRSHLSYVADNLSPEGCLIAEYESLMSANGLMDMTDILRNVIEGLYEGSILPFRAAHIFIDEGQDIDDYQFEWMMCHSSAGTKITLVGDDDQSIYAFRRALGVSGMIRFQEATNAILIKLGTNYRCHHEILKAGELIIKHNTKRIPKQLSSHKGPGGNVKFLRLPDRKTEADAIATAVSATMRENNIDIPEYGQIAILARNNHLLDRIEAALSGLKIPSARTQGDVSIWERCPVIYLVGLLSSLLQKEREGIDSFFAWALKHRDLETIHVRCDAKLTQLLNGSINLDGAELDQRSQHIMRTFLQNLPHWRSALSSTDENSITQSLASLVQWTTDIAPQGERSLILLQFAQEALTKMRGPMIGRLRAIRSATLCNQEEMKVQPPGVTLTTMHGSKGLEFEHVWICYLNDGIIPSPESDIEEERRLLYVAITRAMKTATLSCNMSQSPSQFFAELEAELSDSSRDRMKLQT